MRSTALRWPATERSRARTSFRDSVRTPSSYPLGEGVGWDNRRMGAQPLAARMRPRVLDELVGQQHLIGPGRVLRKAIEAGQLPSMILWGPPGTGKTTLAAIGAKHASARFVAISAVASGVAELRKIIEDSRKLRQLNGQGTVLFIDEIHRFNKAQQDVVLPYVENGDVVLLGATTENPSFEVNSALLSRSRVFTLKPLSEEDVRKSVRGSDPDAALYWLMRMIDAGEDPMFIARRIIILAGEDVGLADPQALVIASAAQQATHLIGLPEGYYPLAEATVYCALAPKSDSLKRGLGELAHDLAETRADPVPLHLRNAPTPLMANLGYGQGYKYAHDYEGHVAPNETYLPESLQGRRYYVPTDLGAEAELRSRLESLRRRSARRTDPARTGDASGSRPASG